MENYADILNDLPQNCVQFALNALVAVLVCVCVLKYWKHLLIRKTARKVQHTHDDTHTHKQQ